MTNVSPTIAAVHAEYARSGVQLHLRPGKTAALVKPRGAGAATLRRSLSSLYESGLPFPDYIGGRTDLSLAISRSYKHLGCLTQQDGGYAMEVSQRAAIVASTSRMYSKKLLANCDAPVANYCSQML